MFFWYPDGDPDQSERFMGSNLDQDTASNFYKDPVVFEYS